MKHLIEDAIEPVIHRTVDKSIRVTDVTSVPNK